MFNVVDILAQHYPQLQQKPWLQKPLLWLLRHLLHEKECIEFGQLYPHLQGREFIEQVLEYFDFSYSVRENDKERVPNSGRVVIIANHPIGSLDGLALLKMLCELRPDIKVVANQMLMAIKPLHPMLLPVNNMQGGTAKQHIQAIHRHLDNDGAVIIFPAGEVSRLRPDGVRDTRWQQGFLRIAHNAKAPVLPIFMDGRNSPLFYGLSMIYKPLATLLLVQEMFKQRSKHLPIRIGEIIPYEAYGNSGIAYSQQVKLFKKHLYRLANGRKPIFQTQKPIALPEDRKALRQTLKEHGELLDTTSDNKQIYLYRHNGSSPLMREIGRLREVAFRAVGEGSNLRRDIDRYDSHYLHLVLWDPEELDIVGAYRFGDARQLMASQGKVGLYSASLFDYDQSMAPYFERGLELGRSFVQPKYWGKRSLDYLWIGIGAFLQQHPEYRYLFGPVSLSNSYPAVAKDLLIQFYSLYFGSEQHCARSKCPYTLPPELQQAFQGNDYQQDFTQLKLLLANMGLAVPTLYKQYTELCEPGGVQFLSFGVDADFNDCVDGLVLVDLDQLKENKRLRYMPKRHRGCKKVA